MANLNSPTHSPNSGNSESDLWDVQEILAERTSITGDNELLVVWKTCWVPHSNVKSGPELDRFRAASKFKFVSAAGDIDWAVEPDTQLARDVVKVQFRKARMATANQQYHDANTRALASDDHRTPREQLGSAAKRACGPHHNAGNE